MATIKNINFRGRDSGCSLLILIGIYIVVVLPLPLPFITTVHAVEETLCDYTSNYTEGSMFESNLNTVLKSLVQYTSQIGFNTSAYGQRPNQIYGLLQCMGDVTVDQCYSCSQNATTTIRSCGNAVGGLIWLDACYLRYENYNFIGQPDTDGLYVYVKSNVSSPDVFSEALRNLLTKLSDEAAQISSMNRYASGTTNDSYSRNISALVQCTRDISVDNCTSCLSDAIDTIFGTYYGSSGVQALKASCIVSYETYSFLNLTSLPPPTAEVASNTSVVSTYSNKILTTTSGVVGGGLLVALLGCMFTTWRRLKGYKDEYILIEVMSKSRKMLSSVRIIL